MWELFLTASLGILGLFAAFLAAVWMNLRVRGPAPPHPAERPAGAERLPPLRKRTRRTGRAA